MEKEVSPDDQIHSGALNHWQPWLDDSMAANGRPIQKNFFCWFGKSRVVHANGTPLVVFHGTGTKIEAFDPSLTGLGNDQLGSGFYFTTEIKQAKGYETAKLPFNANNKKPGGDSYPNTISAFLSIAKPIRLDVDQENLRHVCVTAKQAEEILKLAPGILHPDVSPLINWFDNGGKPFTFRQVKKVASSYTDLMSIENDFFAGQATAFRHAARAATGFDGVEKSFADGSKHFVAWFPEQVKSTANSGLFLPSSPSLTDEAAALALQSASKAKFAVEKVNVGRRKYAVSMA